MYIFHEVDFNLGGSSYGIVDTSILLCSVVLQAALEIGDLDDTSVFIWTNGIV